MIPADVQQYVIVSASEGFQYMEEDMPGGQVRTCIGKNANCRLPRGRNLGSDVGSAPVDSPESVSIRDIPDSVAIVKAKKGITGIVLRMPRVQIRKSGLSHLYESSRGFESHS